MLRHLKKGPKRAPQCPFDKQQWGKTLMYIYHLLHWTFHIKFADLIVWHSRHESALKLVPPSPLNYPCLLPSPPGLSHKQRVKRREGDIWNRGSRPTAQIRLHIEGPRLLRRWRPAACQQWWVHQFNLGSWSSPRSVHHLLFLDGGGLDSWFHSSWFVPTAR